MVDTSRRTSHRRTSSRRSPRAANVDDDFVCNSCVVRSFKCDALGPCVDEPEVHKRLKQPKAAAAWTLAPSAPDAVEKRGFVAVVDEVGRVHAQGCGQAVQRLKFRLFAPSFDVRHVTTNEVRTVGHRVLRQAQQDPDVVYPHPDSTELLCERQHVRLVLTLCHRPSLRDERDPSCSRL